MGAVVCHLVLDLIRGGSEGQCARVAMGLAARANGQRHRVALFHRRGWHLEGVERVCGPVHELCIRHFLRWETLREIRRFAAFLRSEGVTHLHAWDADSAIFGQLAARWAGAKLLTSRRDLGEIYPRHKVALLDAADRRAAAVVANAEEIRRHFEGRGTAAGKIRVIPNLLDLAEYDRLAARAFPGAERLPAGRRLAVVGRLDPEKNVAVLLRALRLVRRRAPDAVLVVAGDGRERAALEALAAAEGVAAATAFLGDTPEIPALLRHVQAGALVPSRNEGQSNAVLEYLAADLPVMATDCGGNRELLEVAGASRLVPADAGPEAVAEAWLALLEGPPAPSCRAALAAKHGSDAVLPRFEALYREV
jgi:glycosyltransferase involved in cell wall biosynthesis